MQIRNADQTHSICICFEFWTMGSRSAPCTPAMRCRNPKPTSRPNVASDHRPWGCGEAGTGLVLPVCGDFGPHPKGCGARFTEQEGQATSSHVSAFPTLVDIRASGAMMRRSRQDDVACVRSSLCFGEGLLSAILQLELCVRLVGGCAYAHRSPAPTTSFLKIIRC